MLSQAYMRKNIPRNVMLTTVFNLACLFGPHLGRWHVRTFAVTRIFTPQIHKWNALRHCISHQMEVFAHGMMIPNIILVIAISRLSRMRREHVVPILRTQTLNVNSIFSNVGTAKPP